MPTLTAMEESPENKIANGPPRNRHERRERETKAKHKARADARREKRRATKATWEMRDALEAMDGVVTLPEGAPVEFLTVKEDPQFLAISFVHHHAGGHDPGRRGPHHREERPVTPAKCEELRAAAAAITSEARAEGVAVTVKR